MMQTMPKVSVPIKCNTLEKQTSHILSRYWERHVMQNSPPLEDGTCIGRLAQHLCKVSFNSATVVL